MAEEGQTSEPVGQSISGMVNQDQVNELLAMGFSKTVSEKALFLTQGGGLEPAIEWIDQHSADPDFEEELMIVGEQDRPKSNLTPAEAAVKARELQARLRREREEKEKALEQTQERDRIRQGKEMQKAKQLYEEAETKRFLDERKREKLEQAREMARVKELLRQDKLKRQGKTEDAALEEVKAPEKPPQEKMKLAIKTIKTLYPPSREPNVAATAFRTLRTLTANLASSPSEDKFRRVRLENATFHDRVGRLNGGLQFLNAVGFLDNSEGFLVNSAPDIAVLNEGVRLLDEAIGLLG